jgi:hypothetical protein
MKFPIALLAVAAAQRQGGSSNDAGRAALVATMIRPPMLGLLMAISLSKPEPAPPKIGKGPKGSTTGVAVFNSVAPKHGHALSFFPTFVGLTKRQASVNAKQLGLDVTIVEIVDGPGKEVVVGQEPAPGANWPHDLREVKLYLA